MKVVVLGGGHCQLNMIKRLKNEGHHIILVDYLNDCPGIKFADEHYIESTFNYDAVNDIVKKTNAEAIITMGTDQPVLTAALTAEKNKIPFYIDSKTAVSVTNKRVMKQLFSKHNIPTVPYVFIGDDFKETDVSSISFPAVLKPLDSQGQRGIFKVNSIEEVRSHIEETLSFSREETVLLEEYYPNEEITANGWVKDNKATIISVVDRVTMDNGKRIGICIAHNHPSIYLDEFAGEIKKITQQIVDSFEIKNGPLYFQFLIGKDGIKVNEIAMRIGGAYEDITIPMISGIDILGMAINGIAGKEVDTEILISYDFTKDGNYISTQLFFVDEGTVFSFTPIEKFKELPYVEDAYYNFHEGSRFGGIENATARAGYFVIRGDSYKQMIDNVNLAYRHLEIKTANGRNIVKKPTFGHVIRRIT